MWRPCRKWRAWSAPWWKPRGAAGRFFDGAHRSPCGASATDPQAGRLAEIFDSLIEQAEITLVNGVLARDLSLPVPTMEMGEIVIQVSTTASSIKAAYVLLKSLSDRSPSLQPHRQRCHRSRSPYRLRQHGPGGQPLSGCPVEFHGPSRLTIIFAALPGRAGR
jgi:hypothetical protein